MALDRPDAETTRLRPRFRRRACWLALAAGVVTLTAVLTVSSLGAAAIFTDVPADHEFAAAIEDLSDRGWLAGFTDGTFRPDALMTRQQFSKALALTLGLRVTEADVCPFADVREGGPHTLYPDNYLGALAGLGVVTGTETGVFRPHDPVMRWQVELMLARAISLIDSGSSFEQLSPLPEPAPGQGDPLTRGQVAYLLAELLACVIERSTPGPGAGEVNGVVRETDGPVTGPAIAGATVTVRATDLQTVSDEWGRYTLTGLDGAQEVVVTAWAEGHFIGASAPASPGTGGVDVLLHHLPEADDPTYEWLSAYGTDPGSSNCQLCHSVVVGAEDPEEGDPPFHEAAAELLPFDEWVLDAHSGSAHNVRFLTMYLGTDVEGNQSPLTRYVWDKDYGYRPLPPDLGQPYYGPGYKLDFTETAGNCAACHVPVAALDDPYGIDPTTVEGVAAEGIGCDFCHKIWDIKVDPTTGLPYENAPGVLSLEMKRPSPGHQLFAGPYKDVAPGEDTYSALQKESLYCAPCHTASFWGTKIYDSYGEWLASPYSDPVTGQTCQDCHMPSTGATLVARAEVGGNQRDPGTVVSHLMPGATDVALLRSALSLDVEAARSAGRVNVTATVTNDKTGHHVPTDSPLRQVLLVVQVTGLGGQPLQLLEGPVLPDWTGVGADPDEGRYAGLPGAAFAKILREPWTGIEPTGAYWNPTVIVSDTRLAAFASDSTTYAFAAPLSGPILVQATLLYRRAFFDLVEQKGWDLSDIVMAERQITLFGP